MLSVIEAEVACGNGLDDDGDGLTDCDDPDCSVACIEDCSDGIDNDLDGSIDCADEDCAPLSVCDEAFFCDDGVDQHCLRGFGFTFRLLCILDGDQSGHQQDG